MPRYIDLDVICEVFSDILHISERDIEEILDKAPNEDVVPRSEVEVIEEERDKYKKYYFRHEYDKWEAEIKQEVASELIIELYDLAKHGKKALVISYEDFDTFRKKHIGENK